MLSYMLVTTKAMLSRLITQCELPASTQAPELADTSSLVLFTN